MFATGFKASAQTAADKYWWHATLTQFQRNANIVRVAQSFPDNTFVGQSCKVWVQSSVVPLASRYVAKIPLNDPYCEWRWQWGPDVEAVATDRWDGVDWWPGYIVQAQVRTTYGATSPHTMIVLASNRWSVTVIESNWRGDNTVRRRTVDWPTMQRQVIHYTLYRVK
jgi:hypothetical protein